MLRCHLDLSPLPRGISWPPGFKPSTSLHLSTIFIAFFAFTTAGILCLPACSSVLPYSRNGGGLVCLIAVSSLLVITPSTLALNACWLRSSLLTIRQKQGLARKSLTESMPRYDRNRKNLIFSRHFTAYEVFPGKRTCMNPRDASISYSPFSIKKPTLHCLRSRSWDFNTDLFVSQGMTLCSLIITQLSQKLKRFTYHF